MSGEGMPNRQGARIFFFPPGQSTRRRRPGTYANRAEPHATVPRMTTVRYAKQVVYEPAGDTLRVYPDAITVPLAMRDARLALDAAGHLVAVIFEGDDPPPTIALGPSTAAASFTRARVMEMETGVILITMGM